MILSVRNEYGRRVVYLFGFRAFIVSESGISLAPNVRKTVDWSEIRNRPASELELVHEQAVGTIDGLNKDFASPRPFGTVYVNGLKQLEGLHYLKLSETSFQLGDAPLPGDLVTTSTII